MANRHSYEYVKKYIENEEGYVLLSKEYKDSISKLDIQCPKDHIFPMSFKVFSKGHRCSYCAGKRQYNIDEVKGIFEDSGYVLLSSEYKGNRDKLLVLGPDGKEYETTLFAFKVNGIIPHLKGKVFKNEEECRDILQEITGEKFPKSNPEWLINPNTGRKMELDGLCEKLKIAFEYDGKHHFQNTNYAKNDVTTTNERDLIKDELCLKNDIRLIRIPFYIKDKYSYIKNKVKHNNSLFIGDPHVQVSNLKDSLKLMDFIKDQAKKHNVSKIVFLGDLFHTHGVIRIEVLNFWKNAFKELQRQYDIIALCGNHDMILGESKYAGLSSVSMLDEQYKYNVSIIDCPTIIDGVAYVPYMSDKAAFLSACGELYSEGATKLLVAHQTFTGATYENGFYAEDGIDPALIPQEYILSGHIHKQQEIGKCFYQGTPKWDTMSDANEDKGIWIYTHNKDMSIKSKKFISTKKVVTPIYKYIVNEGEEDKLKLKKNAKNYIELVGKAAWITKMKKKYKGKANIKARPTDRKRSLIENKSLQSINQYLIDEFEVVAGIDKKDISEYLRSVENV